MSDDPTYNTGEVAGLAYQLVRGSVRVLRGKSTEKADRRMEEIKEKARIREAADKEARRKEEEKRIREKAEKRAARRIW